MQIKNLSANAKNPRKITDEKLAMLQKAMAEFGDLGGIIYNKKSKQLVGGHQRVKTLDPDAVIEIVKTYSKPTKTGTVAEGHVELNGERFKYREVYWPAAKEKAANIAANQGAGEWDLPLLTEMLNEITELDASFDMALTMFDEKEILELGGTIIVSEHTRTGATGVDEDEVPVSPTPRTKTGDRYLLGTHRLVCGDSTDLETVSKLFGNKKAGMIWTDPPYNVAYVGKTKEALTIQNDKMSDDSFREFLTKAYKAMAAVTQPGGGIYVAHADSESINFRLAARDAGFMIKQCLIWKKHTLVMGRQDYHWIHEPILYGWLEGAAHNWYSDRKQTTVLEFNKPMKSTEHPTMKPVELVEYCLGNSSKTTDIVFDPFGGSGTTLIACEKLHRTCFTIELEPRYCDVIVERWEKYTGLKAKHYPAPQVKTRKADKSVQNRESTVNG